jgi:hypothetical protein
MKRYTCFKGLSADVCTSKRSRCVPTIRVPSEGVQFCGVGVVVGVGLGLGGAPDGVGDAGDEQDVHVIVASACVDGPT